MQGVASDVHQRLAQPWDRHQAVRNAKVGPPQAERIDQHQLAHEARALQRQLKRDPASERGADDGGGVQPALLHVALDEAREVWDAIADARFLAATESW